MPRTGQSVVRELEAKLSGASEEELSEFARAEVISVIRQLKALEDIMYKLEKLENELKVQVESNTLQKEDIKELLKQFEELKHCFNTLKGRFSKKIILAYTVGIVCTLVGIAAIVLTFLA